VPVNTHISQTEKKASKQPLSPTLTIHNLDPSTAIDITSVRYYDHAGTKAISEFFHTKQAGRIRISHLGSSGLRSSLASTSRMAPLVRATPLA
jgi:hypothetical protein